MSDVVIRCENLSKQYRIGARQEPYRTLRDTLTNAAKAPLRALTRKAKESAGSEQDTIWALKDVSFEVKRGEVVGIIGRNGAGKSTLLSILSRITEPTAGRARLKGRVAALLEVGTGFNPELTGRENIYLNAAILGMKKAEVDRKFDEILAFAEVDKFIDTPVKHYSSGMYLRLGFAVAAHLEPEILVVDEVLAVGDAEFQKKCLGKMGDVAKSGRTVLFVSHNMAAVRSLCPRTILLKDGRVQLDAETGAAVSRYMNERASSQYLASPSKADSPYVARLWFSDPSGVVKDTFCRNEPITVNVEISNPRGEELELAFAFFDSCSYKLWNFTHEQNSLPPITMSPKALVRVTFFVPIFYLHEIFVHVGLRIKGDHMAHYVDHITGGLRFLIMESPGDTYRDMDAAIQCPVEFRVLPNEG